MKTQIILDSTSCLDEGGVIDIAVGERCFVTKIMAVFYGLLYAGKLPRPYLKYIKLKDPIKMVVISIDSATTITVKKE